MEAWKQKFLQFPGRQDEIEWIRDRIEVLSVREEIILSAAVQCQPPKLAADVIDRIISIPYHGVCAGADSYAALGEFFLRYESPLTLPNDAFAFVYMEALGKQYEDQHPGLFFGGHYVTYQETEVNRPQYDGEHLPQRDNGCSLRLKLGSANRPDGVWICLPDYDEISGEKPGDIQMALKKLKVKHISECTLLDTRCTFPKLVGLMDYSDLADLIYDGQNLGILLDECGQGQPHFMERLQAALELENCDSLKGTLDIAENLHCYDLVLANDLKYYGQKVLYHEHIQEGNKIFDDYIDYEGYARHVLEKKGFQSVLNGEAYVVRNDQAFVSSHVQSTHDITM